MIKVIILCLFTYFQGFMPLKNLPSDLVNCDNQLQVCEVKSHRGAYNEQVHRHLIPTSDVCSTYGYNVYKVYLDLMFTGEQYPEESILEDIENGTSVDRTLDLTGNNDTFYYVYDLPSFNIYQPNSGGAYLIDMFLIHSQGYMDYSMHRISLVDNNVIRGFVYFFYYRDNNNLMSAIVPAVPHQADGVVSDNYNEAFCYDDSNFMQAYGNFENMGKIDSYNSGFSAGYQNGYQIGFGEGIDYAIDNTGESAAIFSGILDVSMIPVNVFLLMFNYEVFGIPVAGLVSGLITCALIIIMFRFIAGRRV